MRKTCAIICTGPSASKIDFAAIKVPKIGINWSFLVTQSDIHVLTSRALIHKQGGNYVQLTPAAHTRISALPLLGAYTPRWIATYDGGEEAAAISKDYNLYKDGWTFAGGSGCALQVAVSFGFDNIVFVGLDLLIVKNFHCFSDEKNSNDKCEKSGHTRKSAATAWLIQTSYLKLVRDGLKEQGIRVTNLGISTVFPPGDFKEIS